MASIPPFFLQDRFCSATGSDCDRVACLVSALKLTGTPAADWKPREVTSGRVTVLR